MSDLLIPGMEMPKSCFECYWRCKVDPENLLCRISGEYFEETFSTIKGRHNSCPLVPVPSHGDLVDLSSPFVAQYYDEMKEEWMEKSVTVRDVLYDCMVYGMPPTIIPAEPCSNLSKPCKEEGET